MIMGEGFRPCFQKLVILSLARRNVDKEGVRGPLRFATGSVVGEVLAVEPQSYVDWNSATATEGFLRTPATSQSTNVASFDGDLRAP